MQSFGFANFSFLAALTLMSLSPQASHAEKWVGGGDLVVCKNKKFGRGHYFFADSYQLIDFGLLDITEKDPEKMIEFWMAALENKAPELALALSSAIDKIQLIHSKEELPEMEDFTLRVPHGCRREQLAIHDLDSGKVKFNQQSTSELSAAERALFLLYQAHLQLKAQARVAKDQLEFADFAATHFLSDRMIREFWFQSVVQKMKDLWLWSISLGAHRSTWCRMLGDATLFKAIPQASRLEVRDEDEQNSYMQELYSSLLAFNSETHYHRITYQRFSQIINNAPDLLTYGIEMSKAQGSPPWVSLKQVNLQALHQQLQEVLSCLTADEESKQLAEKVWQDFEEYRIQINQLIYLYSLTGGPRAIHPDAKFENNR